MKQKNVIIFIIAIILIYAAWKFYFSAKFKAPVIPETKIVYVDGKPTVVTTQPAGPVVTYKTDPKTFNLQDEVFAGQELIVYKTDSVDSIQQGELYRKDQRIGRFISLMPSGRIQVATSAPGGAGIRYIPSNRVVYVK